MVGEKLMNSAGQCLLGAFWDVLRMFPTPKDCFGLSIAGLQLGRRLWSTKRWRLPGEDEPLVVRTVRKKLAKSPGLRPRPSKTFLGCVHSDLFRSIEALWDIACNDCFRSPQSKMTLFFVWSSSLQFLLVVLCRRTPKAFWMKQDKRGLLGVVFWWHRKGKRLELRIKILQVLPSIVDSAVPLA